VHLCRIENRWEELAEQYRLAPYASSDLNSMVMYVRSLGETGNHAALIELFDRVHRSSVQGWYPMGHLSLFAFCGQVEGLERLLSGALVDLPADVADFWRATARETAGRSEAAATLWQSLSHSPDAVVAQALSYRKHHPLLPCPPDLQRHVVVQEAMREMEHESRYGGLMEARGQRRVILLLMAVNVAMFMLEGWKGSSTDDATLQYLGALIPKNVLQGEWWRLITAMFLHAGWLHVTSNLIGLLVLGPFVESTLGGARCLLLYLLSGVGANAVFVVLSRHDPNEMLVGASGAIMGLAGASAAIVLRGWKKEGSAAARRGVGNIAAMLAMQVAFDFNVPGVSDLCHMLGFALGLISGFLLIPRRPMEGGPAARGCERVGHP
jgi:rhomboid protease GluP